jgi:hypothetical protein
MPKAKKTLQHDGRFVIRMPSAFIELVNVMARKAMSNASDYTRRALIAQLERDGAELPTTK